MRNVHFMPWNMGRKLTNETHTLEDLEYGEKN